MCFKHILSILVLPFIIFSLNSTLHESIKTGELCQFDHDGRNANYHLDQDLPDLFILKNLAEVNSEHFHLFSHGRSGELFINNKWLNPEEIALFIEKEFPNLIQRYSQINIYGCEFAKGKKGKKALDYLENALGVSIAASTNITGKAGDWILESGNTDLTNDWSSSYQYNLQIAFEGVEQACINSNVTSITLNVPPGGINDLLVAAIASNSFINETYTPPAGWIFAEDDKDNTNYGEIVTYYRIADGTEPSDYTFSCNHSARMCGAILRYSGVDINNPIDASVGGSSASWINPPPITSTVDNALILIFNTSDDVHSPSNPPAELIERVDISSDSHTIMGAEYQQTTAGFYDPPSYNIVEINNAGVNLAIKPLDPCDPFSSGNPDTDGDGLSDICDLDDDNDGIPDLDERSECTVGAIGSPEFPAFSYNNCSSVAGGTLFTNIGSFEGTAVDMLVADIPGATVDCGPGEFGCSSGDNGFTLTDTDPNTAVSFQFFESGTSIPHSINWAIYLDDFDANEGIAIDKQYAIAYVINSANGIIITEQPSQINFDSESNSQDDLSIYFKSIQSLQITFTHEINNRTMCISSASGDYPSNPECVIVERRDSDNDGVVDELDLDSDNDGIYDLKEAGHSEADANLDGIIDGAAATFGSNGLFDALETTADNAILNYTIADSDADGNINAIETDSDNDGCFDVTEAGFTDGEEDGILGSTPIMVNGNGLITSGIDGYSGSDPKVTDFNFMALYCDTDADGINPIVDIDDDNDGIPDEIEQNIHDAICPNISTTNLTFFDSGLAGDIGDVALYSNVDNYLGTPLDLRLTVVNNTDPANLIVNISGYSILGLYFAVHLEGTEISGTATVRFEYLEAGTMNVLDIPSSFVWQDIDNVGLGEKIKISADKIMDYQFSESTDLVANLVSGKYEFTSGFEGINTDQNIWVRTRLIAAPYHDVEFEKREFDTGYLFGCDAFTNPAIPVSINLPDIDADGVFNHLDLDSDNDGVFDLVEASHGQTDADMDGVIDGLAADFGDNGLFDALETTADNGILDYVLQDSDSDGKYNFIELDSDGDNCFDVNEAGFTDENGDGELGPIPLSIDGDGLVTSGSDGYIDPHSDYLFAALSPCLEICGNGMDDNKDGRTDEVYPGGVEENILVWLDAGYGFGSDWQDKGKNNRDATFVGSPVQNSGIFNFNSAIAFDGDDAVYISLPELLFDQANNSVILFLVYKKDDSDISEGIFGNQDASAINQMVLSNGSIGTGLGTNAVNPQIFNDQFKLLRVEWDEEDAVNTGATNSTISIGGQQILGFSYDNTYIGSNEDFYIGSSGTNVSSQFLQGQVAECIIYWENDGDRALTDLEIQKIESYLSIKYGFSSILNFIGSN